MFSNINVNHNVKELINGYLNIKYKFVSHFLPFFHAFPFHLLPGSIAEKKLSYTFPIHFFSVIRRSRMESSLYFTHYARDILRNFFKT